MPGMRALTVFQLLWSGEFDCTRDAEPAADDTSSSTARNAPKERKCVVVLTGRTQTGETVLAAVEEFRPSLKVLASDSAACSAVEDSVRFSGGVDSLKTETTRIFPFKGYHAAQSTFRTYSFESNMQFMVARKALRAGGFRTYDAALPASMQMLAKLKLSPCGWIEVAAPVRRGARGSHAVDVRLAAKWTSLRAATDPPRSPAPFNIMAFDIECHSSHGDFPRAQKGLDRLARELAELPADRLVDAQWLRRELAAALRVSEDQPDKVSFVHLKRAASAALVDAIAEAVVREFSQKAPKGRGLPNTFTGRSVAGGSSKVKECKREVRVMAALQSTLGLPGVHGDAVIQIGTSMRALGSSEETDVNTIMVLGDCDDVPGTQVRSFKSESALVRAFFSHIRELSPDIVTGYNIFGFDCAYLLGRAQELNIDLSELRGANDPGLFCASSFDDLVGPGWSADIPCQMVVTRGSAEREDTYFNFQGRVMFDLMSVVQKGHSLTSYKLDNVARHFTGEAKDDISPAEIFASHTGTPQDRAAVAKYCIQDCRLVLHLVAKLNTIPNALGMADVCGVPLSWIFLRGQGAKILSLVFRQCQEDGFAVPAMGRVDTSVSYEGATVLDPCIGAYIDEPVVVLDFASLYPSSMISSNISHDTFVGSSFGGGTCDLADAQAHQLGDTLTFDMSVRKVDDATREPVPGPAGLLAEGETAASFVGAEVREGVLPRILKRLLAERKRVRGLIKTEEDPFRRSTLDGLQLAYKITANSLYGQLGAPTSPVFMPELAAATTAVGRRMLQKLRAFAESEAGARVIYGDTDSCFMIFRSACLPGMSVPERIAASVSEGQKCSDAFREHIPRPHEAEYEKVLCPFVLFSKKRYVGDLYDDATSKPRRASMGIVLRRRDNADIVKRIYGGVIDRVMEADVKSATEYARDELVKLVRGKVDIGELTITKTLRAPSAYVDPLKIAHVALAARMNEREPGSAPGVGERMPYVHIIAGKKDALQSERIEHPSYLGRAKIDYKHYLTNQLMKPLAQLFAVLVDKVPGADASVSDPSKKVDAAVRRVVFDPALNAVATSQGGLSDITKFFPRKSSG